MLDEQHPLERTLEAYSKVTEELVSEHPLPPVELAILQRLWGQPETERMVDMFQVTKAQRSFLEQLLGVTLDLDANCYFLSSHAKDA